MLSQPPNSNSQPAVQLENSPADAPANTSTSQMGKQPEDDAVSTYTNEEKKAQKEKQPDVANKLGASKTNNDGQGGNQLEDLEQLSKFLALIHDSDLKEEIEGQVYGLNKQANAAIFLGAIQAQLLDMKSDPQTGLMNVTNTLFVLGILLNVIGAYLALTAATFLQSGLNKIEVELKIWEKDRTLSIEELSEFGKRFIHWAHPTFKGQQSPEYRSIPFEEQCQSIRRFQKAGRLAYVTISLGFFVCPIALGCLVFYHGPLVMKIAVPAVSGCLVLLAATCSVLYRGNTDSIWPRTSISW